MSDVKKWVYMHPFKDELINFERTGRLAMCKKPWRGFKRESAVDVYEYNIDGIVSYTIKVTAFRPSNPDLLNPEWMRERMYTIELPITPDDYRNHFIQLEEGYSYGKHILRQSIHEEYQ